jgi:hypothetical protein
MVDAHPGVIHKLATRCIITIVINPEKGFNRIERVIGIHYIGE